MARIDVLDWSAARGEAAAIREQVFVSEQGVPRELELDDMDARCVHALARLEDGRTIGTGRLLPDGHIGRMAVLAEWRGRGVGGALLERLVEEARARGMREVALSAQTHALGFYARHGFTAEGEVYLEAGIPHRAMRRKLGTGR
ncbi:MAG: GNAT family N-acetyltransferase [Betaproteobacteria bacterium]|nr:GNAT family N-acetyltransferase [Betaproteobacteria bacterium]